MRPHLAIILLLCFAAGSFFIGLNWGLPSREVNRYLFGTHKVWSGAEIIQLAGGWDTSAAVGADIDRNPLKGRDQPIWLNRTDAQRAEIVRRYRLFTYQPDEMITLRALSQMNPSAGRLDPKLYQYGGLWMYPIGGLLKVASVLHVVHVTSDLAYYLDEPAAFGRFYLVARAYSAMWGLVGVAAVWWLVRKLTTNDAVAFFAAMAMAVMPVIVCMSHEAKPHLAGSVLMLLAVLAAVQYVERGLTRDAILTGFLCGAAFSMIIASLPIFILLPAMVLMRSDAWPRRIKLVLLAGVVGGAVYAVTNPYVPINYFFHRDLLMSNVANYGNFYSVKSVFTGTLNAIGLAIEGAGYPVVIAGVIGWLSLHFSPPLLRKQLILLALPAMGLFAQFALLAAGKPGEYGRFLIFPDLALLIGAAIAAGRLNQPGWRVLIIGGVCLMTAVRGSAYLRGFVNDSHRAGTRAILADSIARWSPEVLTLDAEPAPYCLPPVDLFSTHLVLAPIDRPNPAADSEGLIKTVDLIDPTATLPGFAAKSLLHYTTPISWADKPFMIFTRTIPPQGQQP